MSWGDGDELQNVCRLNFQSIGLQTNPVKQDGQKIKIYLKVLGIARRQQVVVCVKACKQLPHTVQP